MKTVYIPTKTDQELPEKGWDYFCYDPNGFSLNQRGFDHKAFRFDAVTKRWFDYDDEVHPSFWLKAVEVKDVPTDKQIAGFAFNADYGQSNWKSDIERGAKWMRDELTPLIASQQNEIARLKSELLFRDSAELPERDAEIERQQNRIAELEKAMKEIDELANKIPQNYQHTVRKIRAALNGYLRQTAIKCSEIACDETLKKLRRLLQSVEMPSDETPYVKLWDHQSIKSFVKKWGLQPGKNMGNALFDCSEQLLSDLKETFSIAILAQQEKHRQELQMIADEREVLIKGFDKIREEFEGRHWLIEGRGTYPYNDDRYKQEVRYIMDAFDKIKTDVWRQINSKSFEYKLLVAKELGFDIDAIEKRMKDAWDEHDKLQQRVKALEEKHRKEVAEILRNYDACERKNSELATLALNSMKEMEPIMIWIDDGYAYEPEMGWYDWREEINPEQGVKYFSFADLLAKFREETKKFYCAEWNKCGFICPEGQCEKCRKAENAILIDDPENKT